ncbi:hypothetical protein [Polyangium sp. 15x6]|uniref:esterase/lipase family protein n=1 Tax=Polyangium sp. 15x6 TaxID=3042687 RepID=UPI00249C05F7|nr:hypothetical protein [Polyangium sp. 15x6]MDI3285887.1 hypothetical protein [Polyangium sp. 15x6]
MIKNNIASWDLMGRVKKDVPAAPTPDAVWEIPGADRKGGKAWVYLANPRFGLTRPVILSDGFHQGPTDLNEFWNGLEGGQFPFASELRKRGHDLVILGYDDCTASILHNASTAQRCIMRALAERLGSAPLTVGGFSMGGLITRYSLAKMENDGMDHQTALYVSYDSPHHGAWMPIGLQALAHALRGLVPALSEQVNSPASRQLLWRHIAELGDTPREDPERTKFLEELSTVGNWPMRPRKLALANGAGKGNSGVPAGKEALHGVAGGALEGFALFSQAAGDNEVVFQGGPAFDNLEKRTSGLPEADGAHGGTLESFDLAFKALNAAIPGAVKCPYPSTSFVPTGSAIAVSTDPWTNLSADVTDLHPDAFAVDDYICASQNEKHTLMTEELGMWLLDRLPR